MEKRIFGLGVFVCLFDQKLEKILLLKRNEEKRIKWNADWGNVGGKIEPGETSIEACIREVKEEIGINLDKNKIILIEVKETPHFTEKIHALHFIYASKVNENTKITINKESDGYEWFFINELPDRMIDKREEIIQILKKYKEKLEK